VNWFQQWDNNAALDVGSLNYVRSHGSIPLVTWEPWVPNGQTTQPSYTLSSIINGNHDSYITSWAVAARNWGHPFFLRFAHEMNGNWYPWSERVNGNQPGQYKQAWQHVYDIFQRNQATQVTFVFCPNVVDPTTTSIASLYPGDAYVHWLGVDGYNWGTSQSWSSWTSFTNIFAPTYKELLAVSTKPILLAETASTESGGNKAAWITDALSQLPKTFPQIKAFVWFNIQKETDWLIESSSAATQAFASGINTNYFHNNTFGNISGLINPPA